ncbi:phage head morphogenesis protein [Pseudoxanthomonas sp. SGD-10]|nr:phage head morphogenesis protein [Pseudoxanthomonas sp. SGD-10]
MAARPDLTDDAIRLQVLLERVKAGEDRLIDQFLREVAEELTRRLRSANLTPAQTARLESLLAEVEAALRGLYGGYVAGLQQRALGTAEVLSEAEVRVLALQGVEASTPTAAALRAAVTAAPLGLRGAGGGLLLEPFLRGWAEADIARVLGVVRRGYFEGRTTEQVVRDVIGTKAARYQDGIVAVSRRTARTVAHTALQHTASVARMDWFKGNEDIITGYRWVSTLDGRTTETCRALDGRVFKVGEGPLPPLHPNCRSTIVPVTKTWRELGIDAPEMPVGTRASMNGQVPADLTYYQWLKLQPPGFVEDVLGPTKAALFLRGGLTPEEFARLQLNRTFQPLTLEELRQKIPKAFERAGV